MNDKSIVGPQIHFRGLVYAPANEQGVVLLFGMVCEDLNMVIEEIKTGFPDCIARQNFGNVLIRKRIELEYKSSNFKTQGHDPDQCDMIICWEHDWIDYPKGKLEIISLKEEIEDFRKLDEERMKTEVDNEEDLTSRQEEREIRDVFYRWNSPPNTKELFYKVDLIIKEIDSSKVWLKIAKYTFNYYSPTHVFAWIEPQVKALSIGFFDGNDWEKRKIVDINEINDILPLVKKSYELINNKYSKT